MTCLRCRQTKKQGDFEMINKRDQMTEQERENELHALRMVLTVQLSRQLNLVNQNGPGDEKMLERIYDWADQCLGVIPADRLGECFYAAQNELFSTMSNDENRWPVTHKQVLRAWNEITDDEYHAWERNKQFRRRQQEQDPCEFCHNTGKAKIYEPWLRSYVITRQCRCVFGIDHPEGNFGALYDKIDHSMVYFDAEELSAQREAKIAWEAEHGEHK
jgi:hypothetical protein